MQKKRWLYSPRAPELDPHHQLQYHSCVFFLIYFLWGWGRHIPLERCSQCIIGLLTFWQELVLYITWSSFDLTCSFCSWFLHANSRPILFLLLTMHCYYCCCIPLHHGFSTGNAVSSAECEKSPTFSQITLQMRSMSGSPLIFTFLILTHSIYYY